MPSTSWVPVVVALLVGTGLGYFLGRRRYGAARREADSGGPGAWSRLSGAFPKGLLAGLGCAVLLGALALWMADRKPEPKPVPQPVAAGIASASPHEAPVLTESLAKRDQYIAAHPDDLEARREMALILISEKRYMDALGQADQILERQPDDPTAFYVQGIVRLTMGQRTRGRALLEQAIEVDPGHVHSLIALGRVHLQDGRRSEAISVWRAALEAAGGRHPGIEKMLADAETAAAPWPVPADGGSSGDARR